MEEEIDIKKAAETVGHLVDALDGITDCKKIEVPLSEKRKEIIQFAEIVDKRWKELMGEISKQDKEAIERLKKELRPLSLQWISGGCDAELCAKSWDKKLEEILGSFEK